MINENLINLDEEVEEENTEGLLEEEPLGNGEVIFETEYAIEDYSQGCFIVSKSDRLLYGVIDLNNQEILPIKYDRIFFLNADEVKEGTHQNTYILTKYEDQYAIYNTKGKKILDSEAEVISYLIGNSDENSPFFYSQKKLYNEDGTVFSSIGDTEWLEEKVSEIEWISPEYFLVNAVTGVTEKNRVHFGAYLYSTNGELLKKWEETVFTGASGVDEEKNVYEIILNTPDSFKKLTVNPKKEEYSIGKGFSYDKFKEESTKITLKNMNPLSAYYLGKNKDIKLYTTNDTWKLEDSSGTPLYDERYFSKETFNSCYLLSNEDNEVCIIAPSGEKVVDYGYIELRDDSYLYQDSIISDDNLFSDYNSICLVKTSSGLSEVHYFVAK